jgi:presenilin-like A22 family membrane protease
MKHSIPVTSLLVILFVIAQVIGLTLLFLNIQDVKVIDGKITVQHEATVLGERPQSEGGHSLLFLLTGVALGTVLVLLLIKYKIFGLWKLWFLVAVWFSASIALGVLIPGTIALIICLGLSIWKVYFPNPWIHNLTEVFMYAGLAVLLVPIFSLGWMLLLLLIISVYDMIAVWYSKHMIVMAKAQTESKLFAGLYIPKNSKMPAPRAPGTSGTAKGTSSAILGGGDIAFPLLFSGVAMDWLLIDGASRLSALLLVQIITITTAASLLLLFIYAKKDKFYPAMPFLSLGAVLGFGIIWLIRL